MARQNIELLGRTSMVEGSPIKHLIVFSAPLLLGNILQQSYNIADTIIVGNFISSEALASVGLSFPIIFLFTALFMGLGQGATIVISQYFGARNMRAVNRAISTIMLSMLVLSIPMSVAGYMLARPILVLLNTPPDIIDMSTYYLQITFAGLLPSLGYNINAGILQGLGDSRTSLYFLGIATALNIALDVVFITVFGWGVPGVAAATVIAQFVAFTTGVLYINKKDWPMRIRIKEKPDWPILVQSVRLGLPSGIQNIMFSLGSMVLQRLINSFGEDFIAGYVSASRIDSFCFMPMASMSMAMTAFAGQNVGAGKTERVSQGLKDALRISLVLCVVLVALALIFGKPLLTVFNGTPAVVDAGWNYMLRIMPGYVLLAVMFILSGMLRGCGASFVPMVASMISMMFARLPLAYLFAHLWGGENLWLAFPVGWLIGDIILVAYVAKGRWREKSVTRAYGAGA